MCKKIAAVLFCALFFLSSVILAAGAFLGGEDAAAEGRELAPFPSWKTEDGSFNSAFFMDFDAWLTDRFTGRQQLISANAWIREHVFATGSDQVIVGRDGFLFYADTVPDYTGEGRLSDEEIAAVADALLALSDYAAEKGARLIVAVAPNKNTVYGDRMPAVYAPSGEASNMTRLHAALGERGVLYTDLRDALTDDGTLLYHKRDTHWNGMGALRAYDAILDTAGIPHEDYAGFPTVTARDFPGDLDGMLYPSAGLLDDNTLPDADFDSRFIYTSAYRTSMDMIITTRGQGEGKALIFRDSFGSALIPYFSSAFAEVQYERALPFRIDLLEKFDADLVVVEIAERNIKNLLSAADRIR